MNTTFDKALSAAIISVIGLLALIFHWSVPGYVTETNIMQILVILMPIVVAIIPNKPTAAQKAQVLTEAGVATTVTKS